MRRCWSVVVRNPFLVLNLGLHAVDSVGRFNFEGDVLASQGLDEDLHSTAKTENEMKAPAEYCDQIGCDHPRVAFQKDKALLVRDGPLVLNLCLYVVGGVGRKVML